MHKFSVSPALCLLPLLAVSLTSCDKEAKAEAVRARAELSDKQVEVDDLKEEVRRLESEVRDLAKKAEEAKANKAASEDLEDIREKNEALEKEAEKLREENGKLRSEATRKARAKAIGEEMAELSVNGKVYRNVVIKSIDDHGVSIMHEAGRATLRHGNAPKGWAERFSLVELPEPGSKDSLASVDGSSVGDEEAAPDLEPRDPVTERPAKEEANRLMGSKSDGILIVEDEEGAGSAFLARSGGQIYLYTAAHVLTGKGKISVRNPSGMTVGVAGRCEVAADCDLARIEVNVDPKLALAIAAPGKCGVGTKVRAVGNSGGRGVLTVLDGKVTKMAPTELELSSNVVKGNSGGPVFCLDTAEVVGVVTHALTGGADIWSSDKEEASKIRRFAGRIDRQIVWRPKSLESLQSEKERIAIFDSRTRLMLALATLEPGQKGLRLDMRMGEGRGPTVLAILLEHRHLGPVQKLINMNRGLGERKLRTSEQDLAKRFGVYYRELLAQCAADTAKLDPEHFSFPNRKRAELSRIWRKDATLLLRASASAIGR